MTQLLPFTTPAVLLDANSGEFVVDLPTSPPRCVKLCRLTKKAHASAMVLMQGPNEIQTSTLEGLLPELSQLIINVNETEVQRKIRKDGQIKCKKISMKDRLAEYDDGLHDADLKIEPLLEQPGEKNLRTIQQNAGQFPRSCILQMLWHPDVPTSCVIWWTDDIMSLGLPGLKGT